MAFVFIYSLISILVFTCGCIPVTAMWDMTQMATAKCVDQLAFVYANAAFNLLSDLMTLILPIRLCWSLQTTLKQKILLGLVLAMGSFACVIAIVRIVTMMPFVHSMDFTWYKVTLAKWAYVSSPVFPPFLECYANDDNEGWSKSTWASSAPVYPSSGRCCYASSPG
jgi:hypothetical protein